MVPHPGAIETRRAGRTDSRKTATNLSNVPRGNVEAISGHAQTAVGQLPQSESSDRAGGGGLLWHAEGVPGGSRVARGAGGDGPPDCVRECREFNDRASGGAD